MNLSGNLRRGRKSLFRKLTDSLRVFIELNQPPTRLYGFLRTVLLRDGACRYKERTIASELHRF